MYTASSNFGTGGGSRLGGPGPRGGRRRRGRRGNLGVLAVFMVIVLGAGWGGCALDPQFGDTDVASADPRANPARQVASLEPVPLDPSLDPGLDPSLDPSMVEPAAGTDQANPDSAGGDQSAALPEAAAVDPSATVVPSQNYRIDPLVPEPVIEDAKRRTDSVAYARERSGIKLHGQPWRWWSEARGRYHRGQIPSVGAVMVFKRAGRSNGHLAVVTHRVGYRDIIVDHANWGTPQAAARGAQGGRIGRTTPVFRNTRVRDVSPANDWSQVQIWPAPETEYGATIYATSGFVYPVAMTEILDIHALYKNDRSLLVGAAPAAH